MEGDLNISMCFLLIFIISTMIWTSYATLKIIMIVMVIWQEISV